MLAAGRRRRPATNSGAQSAMPAAPCTSGSTHDRGEPVGVLGDQARRRRRGRRRARARTGNRSGSNTSVPNPPSPTDERPDGVAVVGAAEGQVAVAPGDALVRPVLERDLQRLLDGRGAVAGEEEVGLVDRARPAASASASSIATVLPLPSIVEWATRSSWSRSGSSSSGTRWPRVVTHSDEMASR